MKGLASGFVRYRAYIWLPLLIGSVLRAHGLLKNSIWYDESFTIYLTRQPLFEMVRLISLDFHPPLWEIITWFTRRIFGESELSFRFLSLVASIAALWVLYKIMEYFTWSKGDQFLVLLLAAILPYQAWMAQDARVYALLSFLYLLSFYLILRRKYFGFIGTAGLMLYTNNAAPFYLLSLMVLFIYSLREKWKIIFFSFVAIFVSFLPWSPVFWKEVDGSYFEKPVLDIYGAIDQLAFIFAPQSVFYIITSITSHLILVIILLNLLIAMAALTIQIILKTQSREENRGHATIHWLLIGLLPVILIATGSVTYDNVFIYRPLSMISLPVIVMTFALIRNLKILKLLYIVPLIAVIIIHWGFWSPADKGGYLKETLISTQSITKPDDVFFHATATTLLPFSYYLPEYKHVLLDENLSAEFLIAPLQQAYQLQKMPLEKVTASRIWIIWSIDPALPDRVHQRMKSYTQNAVMINQINYPQAAKIKLFLLEK